MKRYWDIHNHILPGVDDGARDLDESIEMIAAEREQGFKNIIVTPHLRQLMYQTKSADRQAIFERLKRRVQMEIPDVNIYLGCEIFYNGRIEQQLQKTPNRMMGKNIAMLEFPSDLPVHDMAQTTLGLLKAGYKVSLAHVEKYRAIINEPYKLKAFKKAGCLIQVNADTVIYGARVDKTFVDYLMEENLLGCVSSDAHNNNLRPVQMGAALHAVEKRYGKQKADELFSENIESFFEI